MSNRDYTSIGQSARWLALTKATTNIPYARAAAVLLFGEATVLQAETAAATLGPHRLAHFDHRYRSIDEALGLTALRNIVEIGAGLSFRGLALSQTPGVHYLDTDLPDMITVKADLMSRLDHPQLEGTLRLEPLDALAPGALAAAVRRFPAGPVAIVNEGLLMYLDAAEKEQLAATIRKILRERDGSRWITADCYVREAQRPTGGRPEFEKFIADHRVEEQKFASWECAERFFETQGFTIEGRLQPDEARRIRETWILRVAP
ncbi:MAG: class I SAM-dependent methyltransferase [Gemmatimonadales bacterium]